MMLEKHTVCSSFDSEVTIAITVGLHVLLKSVTIRQTLVYEHTDSWRKVKVIDDTLIWFN